MSWRGGRAGHTFTYLLTLLYSCALLTYLLLCPGAKTTVSTAYWVLLHKIPCDATCSPGLVTYLRVVALRPRHYPHLFASRFAAAGWTAVPRRPSSRRSPGCLCWRKGQGGREHATAAHAQAGSLGGCRRCCEPRAQEARWRGVRAGLERTPGHARALSHAARLVRVRVRVGVKVRVRARARAWVRARARVRVRVRVRLSHAARHSSSEMRPPRSTSSCAKTSSTSVSTCAERPSIMLSASAVASAHSAASPRSAAPPLTKRASPLVRIVG